MNAAAAIGDGYSGAVGVGIVTLPAFTVGITVVPTPLTEVEWEGWLYHQFFDIRAGLDVGLASHISQHWAVDSKAMRKFDDINLVLMSLIEVIEQGTSQIEIGFNTRMLVKLP